MVSLKSGFPLLENERLVLEIESKLYMTSSILFLRIIWGILRPILQIFGFNRKGFLIATDKRFVVLYTQTIFWFLKLRNSAECIPLEKIGKTIRYVKKGRFLFFCRAYHVSFDRCCWRVYFILKGMGEEDAQKISNRLYQLVSSVK